MLDAMGRMRGLSAEAGEAAGGARAHNAHVHLPPNFSAFESVGQAVALAAQQGLALLGASNYYDYSVYEEFAELAGGRGIFPLFGLEVICLLPDLQQAGVRINDPANPGKMYLCGKGMARFAPFNEAGGRLVGKIRDADSARMARMCDKLEARFADAGLPLGLGEQSVRWMIAQRHGSPMETIYLQERHLCQAAQERLFARVPEQERATWLTKVYGVAPGAGADDVVGTQNEIRSQLMKAGKPAYVPETFVDFEQAYQMVEALGGIVSYPVLIDGVKPMCEFEATPEALIEHLGARKIHAVEFIPVRNGETVLRQYVTALREAGFVVTAGTEHNTLDLIPMAPTCAGGAPIPSDLQEIFWEGACVVAAHQVRMLQGKSGYQRGRIEEFAGIGRRAIKEFQAKGNGR